MRDKFFTIGEISSIEDCLLRLKDSNDDFRELDNEKIIEKMEYFCSNKYTNINVWLLVKRAIECEELLEYVKSLYYKENYNECEIDVKIKAQEDYCEKENVLHFAPTDGICYRCDKQIYHDITLDEASNELITGCPICGWSYCD